MHYFNFRMLIYEIIPAIHDALSDEELATMIYQQDGSAIQQTEPVIRLLYNIFNGPTNIWTRDNTAHNIRMDTKYPPESADLSLCDFAAFLFIDRKIGFVTF